MRKKKMTKKQMRRKRAKRENFKKRMVDECEVLRTMDLFESNTAIAEKVTKAQAKVVARETQRQSKNRAKDTVLRIFTWNIQTLSETVKEKKVAEYDEVGGRRRNMKNDVNAEQDEDIKREEKTKDRKKLSNVILRYKSDIMALQEVRWSGQGCKEFETYDIYYSCNEAAEHHGTAFVVSHVLRKFGIKFTPVNSRLCVLRLEKLGISFINIYAPTTSELKDDFYVILDTIYDNCPRNDVKLMIGDANARIGKESFYKRYTGCHSLHSVTDDNGVRLINFAVSKNMRLGSTYFERRYIYKGTYICKKTNQLNQIDHVLIDSEHFSKLLNVRTYRGCNKESDHFLVGAKLRVKLSENVQETTKGNTKNESLSLEKQVLFKTQRYITDNLPFIDHKNFSITDILTRQLQLSDDNEGELKKLIKDWLNVDFQVVPPSNTQMTHDRITNESPGEFSRPEIKELMTQIRKVTADDNLIYESLSNVLYDCLRRLRCINVIDECVIRQICVLRRILESAFKHNEIVYHLFIDFESTYDRLPKQMLYETMNELEIPKKFIYLTQLIIDHAVKVRYDTSKSWKARRSQNGGGALTQLLFNILLQKIIRDTGMDRSNIYDSKKLIQIVAYGCHMDIIARSPNDMWNILDVAKFLNALKLKGISINANKMKFTETTYKQRFASYNEHYAKLYLGYFIDMHNIDYSGENISNDIKRKSMLANMCYYELTEYFNNERIYWKDKMITYAALLMPVLTYALNTGKIYTSERKILFSFKKRIFDVIRRKIIDEDQVTFFDFYIVDYYNDKVMIDDISHRNNSLIKDITKSHNENLRMAFPTRYDSKKPKNQTMPRKRGRLLERSDLVISFVVNKKENKAEE